MKNFIKFVFTCLWTGFIFIANDATLPEITCDPVIYYKIGDEKPTLTATAIDNNEYKFTYVKNGETFPQTLKQTNDLSSNISIDQSNVNWNVAGTYTIKYSVSDEAGNVSTKNQILYVTEKDKLPKPFKLKLILSELFHNLFDDNI